MSNHITVTGNLTRDPELRFTQGGKAVCNLGVADDHRYMKDNEWQSDVTFHNLTIWGDLGENVAASLFKGDTIVCNGRLAGRTWEDAEGAKRTSFDIIVDSIGPSLRWVTTTSDKVAKGDSKPRPNATKEPAHGDEEPF